MTCGEDENAYPAHSLKYVAAMHDIHGDKAQCYLYWKDKGDHASVFTKGYTPDTDHQAYADMFTFIDKCLEK